MVRQRPTSILVIAILHLIGGGLGIFGSCYTIAIMTAAGVSSSPTPTIAPSPANPPGRPAPPTVPSASQIMKYYDDHVPGYKAVTLSTLAVSLVLDLMLLASGIGLLKMRPWGRVLSLVYAPLSIVFHLISFAYQLAFVMPATSDFYSRIPALGQMGYIIAVATDIAFVLSLLVIVYPIVVLFLMLRRSTAAAFREETPAEVDDWIADAPSRPTPRGDAFTS